MHGYRNYAGAALNLAADAETAGLNTIESGASMYYSCMTEPYTVVKKPGTPGRRCIRFQRRSAMRRSLNATRPMRRFLSVCPTQVIDRHEITPEGVHLTVYEDGTVVAVNYTTQALTWENVTVEPRSFAVVQRENTP